MEKKGEESCSRRRRRLGFFQKEEGSKEARVFEIKGGSVGVKRGGELGKRQDMREREGILKMGKRSRQRDKGMGRGWRVDPHSRVLI